MKRPRPASAKRSDRPLKLGIVLQGGGALGAYELGVLERLYAEPGFELSYVSGVSIGAITAAVLVGARSGDPIAALKTSVGGLRGLAASLPAQPWTGPFGLRQRRLLPYADRLPFAAFLDELL